MRRLIGILILTGCLAVPQLALATARAPRHTATPGSRVGVVLMVVCGLSFRLMPVAPVPFAGIAAVSCAVGMLNAMIEPD